MPTYEFRCPDGHEFERFYRKMSDATPEVACPECGKLAVRLLSGGAGIHFKGSGFYLTDYGKNAHRGAPAGASGDGKGSDAPGGESKSGDAKGEAKSETKATDAKGGETKGASGGDSKGGETKVAAAKPAESKPSEAKSSSSKKSDK
jgi:putative FmdB family regulatory protein